MQITMVGIKNAPSLSLGVCVSMAQQNKLIAGFSHRMPMFLHFFFNKGLLSFDSVGTQQTQWLHGLFLWCCNLGTLLFQPTIGSTLLFA
ncbi:hypothetical protein PEC18_19050 [Paucibacter sp. O1-1]|nr:hypothetical protein [Paucibacter sp. O1-1]MDA3827893.1 hypothetical protein [Paucibacter sp. O1-1]